MTNATLARPGLPARAEADDDACLAERARRDPAAFTALYRRHVTSVYRYFYGRLGHAGEAEELTSQVFMEALSGLGKYRERGSFVGWLFTIARRRLVDYHRASRPHVPFEDAYQHADEEPDPLSRILHQEDLARLAVLIQRLDEEQQELLRLRFAGGLTYKEVATVLKRSEGAVKMATHRLLRQLEDEWEKHHE